MRARHWFHPSVCDALTPPPSLLCISFAMFLTEVGKRYSLTATLTPAQLEVRSRAARPHVFPQSHSLHALCMRWLSRVCELVQECLLAVLRQLLVWLREVKAPGSMLNFAVTDGSTVIACVHAACTGAPTPARTVAAGA